MSTNKLQHRRYCGKSIMRCLVYHPDGICPDITDCEACKEERGEFNINFEVESNNIESK